MNAPTATVERLARRRLGIPDDAARVLILAESSHWDPDWLLTSEEYYRTRVERVLDQAIDVLAREARRVYSLEHIFFLRLYFERRAGRRSSIRALVNERRLRLTGSAMTTPDRAEAAQ